MKLYKHKIILSFSIGALIIAIVIAVHSGLQRNPTRLRQAVVLMAIRNYFSETEGFRKPELDGIIGKGVGSSKSLSEIPFLKDQVPLRIEVADKTYKPISHHYLIVYNLNFSRDTHDWIAFIKAVDIESKLLGYLTLWNNGEIERVKNTEALLGQKHEICFYKYNAQEKF